MKLMLGIAVMLSNSFKIWFGVSLGYFLYAKSLLFSFRILESHLFIRFRSVLVLACVKSLIVVLCNCVCNAIRYVLSLYLRAEKVVPLYF